MEGVGSALPPIVNNGGGERSVFFSMLLLERSEYDSARLASSFLHVGF
jgi:hypothetical protein